MKHTPVAQNIGRKMMRIFSGNKGLSITKRYPERYYKHIYINKSTFDGIVLFAKMKHMTRKRATEFMLNTVLSAYFGSNWLNELRAYEKECALAAQSNKKLDGRRKVSDFMRNFRKLAKERDVDISKLLPAGP